MKIIHNFIWQKLSVSFFSVTVVVKTSGFCMLITCIINFYLFIALLVSSFGFQSCNVTHKLKQKFLWGIDWLIFLSLPLPPESCRDRCLSLEPGTCLHYLNHFAYKYCNTCSHFCVVFPPLKFPLALHLKQYWKGPEVLRRRETLTIYALDHSLKFQFCGIKNSIDMVQKYWEVGKQ